VLNANNYNLGFKGTLAGDTTFKLSENYEPEVYDDYTDSETITDKDSAATYDDTYNYDYESSDYDQIKKDWKAAYAYSDNEEESSELKEDIILQFTDEETVTLKVGKKKYKCTWRLNEDDNLLYLTYKGKDYIGHYYLDEYTFDLNMVFPREKKAKTITFDEYYQEE